MQTKNELRTKYKRIRKDIDDSSREEAEKRVLELLVSWEEYQKAEIIYGFYPLGDEINVLPILLQAMKDGKRVVFPKVNGDEMHFYPVTDLGQFEEGCFHVMEPKVFQNAPIEQESFDLEITQQSHGLMLVPGLVYDEEHFRLGYGKGYYDRYLSTYPGIKTVGVCFDVQISEEKLPSDTHDKKLDYVLTEEGFR